MTKSSFITLLDNALIFIWGIFLLILPFIITTATTDVYILPKEITFGAVVLVSLLLLGVKMIVSEKVTFRRTPFDVPMLLFLFAILLSALFAVDRMDSLIATAPVLLAGVGVFLLTNTVKKENTIVFILSALLIGGAATATLALFSYLKVYPILFPFTHVQSFTPLGSLVEQAFYFFFLLPISLALAMPITKGITNNKTVTASVVSVLLVAGLAITLLQLFTTQKPIFLPFETGFQTAFASISQDTGRIAQGFLFGSGYGNYASVFTKFKQASFNANAFWAQSFNNSSSYLLELLATTGVLGMLAFLFLFFRVVLQPTTKKANPVFFGLVILAIVSLILPFSFFEVALLFVLLGLFSATQGIKDHTEYYDVEVKLVALKKGMISLQQITVPSHEKLEYNKPTSYAVAAILLIIVAVVGWYGGSFVFSDVLFQKSLVLASSSNGTATYQYQTQAISMFPNRSVYYRIFAQTNIALAGSLASLSKGSSPSAQTQNTMYTLIQQGITAGKQATTLAPQDVTAWQNLSSVYRSLIGVGQNADSFAVLAAQQAITLDPTNPQEYVALGGLYYQLGQWDNAIKEFQQAITLKQDYSNAYYNLAHAYQQKGDYQNALAAYQTVQQLVAGNKANLATVNTDIKNLQAKMGSNSQSAATPTPTPAQRPSAVAPTQGPLNLSGQQNSPVGPSQQAGQPATPTTAPSPAQAQ